MCVSESKRGNLTNVNHEGGGRKQRKCLSVGQCVAVYFKLFIFTTTLPWRCQMQSAAGVMSQLSKQQRSPFISVEYWGSCVMGVCQMEDSWALLWALVEVTMVTASALLILLPALAYRWNHSNKITECWLNIKMFWSSIPTTALFMFEVPLCTWVLYSL